MKIIFTLIIITISFTGLTFGQEKNNLQSKPDSSAGFQKNDAKHQERPVIEVMPKFPGGEEALIQYVKKNVNYPAEAKKNKITGKVYVMFVIDKEGNVKDPKVVKGIGGGCDEEALRVVKSMPKWSPGIQDGRPVDVSFNLPLVFGIK